MPTKLSAGELILKAVKKRLISYGVHPSRVIYIPKADTAYPPVAGPYGARSRPRLVIRHNVTSPELRLKTSISHDDIILTLYHIKRHVASGFGIDESLKKVPLGDPDLMTKVINLLRRWDTTLIRCTNLDPLL